MRAYAAIKAEMAEEDIVKREQAERVNATMPDQPHRPGGRVRRDPAKRRRPSRPVPRA